MRVCQLLSIKHASALTLWTTNYKHTTFTILSTHTIDFDLHRPNAYKPKGPAACLNFLCVCWLFQKIWGKFESKVVWCFDLVERRGLSISSVTHWMRPARARSCPFHEMHGYIKRAKCNVLIGRSFYSLDLDCTRDMINRVASFRHIITHSSNFYVTLYGTYPRIYVQA